MIISSAVVHTREVPLKEPYTIAYDTFDSVTNHYLVLTTESGLQGVGCSAPAPGVTGESESDARQALDAFCLEAPGADLGSLPIVLAGHPSASAAVDLALHDLRARHEHMTVGGLFGDAHAAESPRETSVTVGISSLESTLDRATALVRQGFGFLKVKGGMDVQADIDRLTALRDRFGSGIKLALDANQGYDLGDVRTLDRAAETLGLEYLEQPTAKDDVPLLGAAARETGIPVMADEAVQTAADVVRIAASGPVALINIKLQKMGGLAPAADIDRAARDGGMRTMLGCMDESALSIAAALHFGATHPNVAYLDLDGHFDLMQDPFADLVRLDGAGRLSTVDGPGLGWTNLPFS